VSELDDINVNISHPHPQKTHPKKITKVFTLLYIQNFFWIKKIRKKQTFYNPTHKPPPKQQTNEIFG
jgi:hypothetical protein